MIDLTEHSLERAKERMSWNADVLLKMATKAFESGHKPKELRAALKRFIDAKAIQHRSTAYIYGEVAYFFKHNRLITLFEIPNDLKKCLKKLKKT
jgi:hypothetical protein